MALSQSTLRDELKKLEPTDDEATAIQRLVDAWVKYFEGSSLNSIAATAGSLSVAAGSMSTGLVGMSATGAAGAKIQAGLTAFWGGLSALATTIWVQTPPAVVTPPVVPPPLLVGVGALLAAQFAINVTNKVSRDDAADNLSAILHANAGLGGMVGITVPPTLTPTPIL